MRSGNRRDVSRSQKAITRFSDQALAYSAKKIFGIGAGFFHESRLVAEFHFYFLQRQFYRDFRLVAAFYERLSTVGESVVGSCLYFFFGGGKVGADSAFMIAELRGSQAVIGAHGLL